MAAIRKVARLVPGGGGGDRAGLSVRLSRPGKPDIDWEDMHAKQALVSDLVNDALAVPAEPPAPMRARGQGRGCVGVVGAGCGSRRGAGRGFRRHRRTLAHRAEGGAGSGDLDRGHRDPATRKSKSNRRDGFRGHVSAEPETGLITDWRCVRRTRRCSAGW